MDSIIQNEKECYLCRAVYKVGTPTNEVHHCLHGSVRQLADEDGLTVHLCRFHHDRLHNKGEFDKSLQILAQNAYIGKLISEGMDEDKARENFRNRYGRFYF